MNIRFGVRSLARQCRECENISQQQIAEKLLRKNQQMGTLKSPKPPRTMYKIQDEVKPKDLLHYEAKSGKNGEVGTSF